MTKAACCSLDEEKRYFGLGSVTKCENICEKLLRFQRLPVGHHLERDHRHRVAVELLHVLLDPRGSKPGEAAVQPKGCEETAQRAYRGISKKTELHLLLSSAEASVRKAQIPPAFATATHPGKQGLEISGYIPRRFKLHLSFHTKRERSRSKDLRQEARRLNHWS